MFKIAQWFFDIVGQMINVQTDLENLALFTLQDV